LVARTRQLTETGRNVDIEPGQPSMHRWKILTIALVFALASSAFTGTAFAQEGPGGLLNPQRDCQTIRTCNFRRGGSYRGCLSSYSCRVCRFVRTSCRGLGRGKVCRKLRCTWGGIS
jgi:hypothetical protein